MRKFFLVLVVLLLVSMVLTNQAQIDSTRIFVNPSSSGAGLNPQTPITIRPNADGTVSTLKEWTNSTVVLRPNSEGTYSDWAGSILTLKPNGEGSYREWPAWIHLQPTEKVDQNYTKWAGASGDWDDWPDPDNFVVSASSAIYNDWKETSALMPPPTQRRDLAIQKLRVNIVAGYSVASDEEVQIMLCSVLNANVSSFMAASGWDGWIRTGSSPWLDKEDYPSNYVNSSVTGDKIGNFTFADIPEGLTWNPEPGGVVVRFRIWQSYLGDDSVNIHVYNGTHWKMFTGLTPVDAPDPSYVQYGTQTDMDVSSFLNTREKINNAKMAIEKVTVGTPDTIYVDYACIHLSGVTTASSYGLTTGLTPSYKTYYSDWSTNPLTGAAWTWSDMCALQAGVRAIQVGSTWSGILRVNQLYVGILTNQGFYTDWDEYPDPTGPNGGDEDLFSATTDALRQSSVLTNHGSEAWTISKVRVTAAADNPDTLDVSGREVVTGWTGWSKTGSDPYLDAADYTVNYIYTSTGGARIGNFTFRDAPAGTITWDTATLRLRAWRTSTAASTPITVYLFDGTSWTSYSPTLSTTSGSYVDISVSSFLNSEAKINAAKMALEKLGASGTVYVDYACLSLADRERIQLMIAEPPFDFKANATSTTLDTAWRDWTRVPTGNTGTWLNSPDYPTSYIHTSTNGYKIGFFPFQDITTGATWSAVTLRLKTWQTGADGSDYMNMEVYDGTTWSTAYKVTPPTAAAPGSYVEVDVSGFLNTVAKINAAQIRLTKVTVGTADAIGIDHAYIHLSGVAYCGAETALTTTYTGYTTEWTTNPASGLAWTWSDIDNLEAGVRSKMSGAWTGEIRVTQLYVKVFEAGTYAYWDDPLPDYNGDTDYLSAISGKLNQSSGLEDQPAGATWTPARVQVTIVAKTDISTDEKVRIMLVISGAPSPYYGTSYTLTTSYATYTQVWTTNPFTSGNWDWTTITNMQAGVQSVQTGATWKGEMRVTQLYVIVGRDGTYGNWDEPSPNGDTDYFSATMTAMEESSQLADVTTPPSWEIGRVRVAVVARTNVTTDEQVQLMLVIGGTAYYATEAKSLTTTYATYTADWGKNPKFNIPWNWTAINSLEAGVSSKQVGSEWKGEIRVTQLSVEIAGPRFTVNIDVENVANLYGYSIMLRYNTAVTSATAIIFNDTFFPADQTVLREEVNDALGYVWFESQMPGSAMKSGNGTLATIFFLVDFTGATTLDLRVLEFYTFGPYYPEIYTILGDVERDRKIDIYDLSILSNDYGSKEGDSNWNGGRCDFSADSQVDVLDLFNQSKNYGKAYAYDGYFNNG